jgi:AhpD family alkylhydroperoxidase
MEATPSQSRINYFQAAPEPIKAMQKLEHTIRNSGLEAGLLDLVKIRASQMNGCAFCIDMHTKDARQRGETEQRIYNLNAWPEAPFYTNRERAALTWTEAITNIQQGHASDEAYQAVSAHFNESELVNLTLAITTINAWNRIALGFRVVPGTYQADSKSAQA